MIPKMSAPMPATMAIFAPVERLFLCVRWNGDDFSRFGVRDKLAHVGPQFAVGLCFAL
jgi:hypothetical protein